MAQHDHSIRSPLSRAKGHGSDKHSAMHWIALRISSVPLIPLFVYFVTQVPFITSTDHQAATNWVAQPVNTIALIVFIFCAFYHAMLGMDEIIIDYIRSPGCKLVAVLLNKGLFFLCGVISIYSVLALSFGVL